MKSFKFKFVLAILLLGNLAQVSAQCNVSFNTVPTLSEGCDVLGVQFNSVVSGTTLGTPVWDFGDGSAKFNGKNPFHNYTTKRNDTTYTVTLSVTCLDGSTTQKKGNVVVFAKPKADFVFSVTELCMFSDTLKPINTSSTGGSLTYKWDFGDNGQSIDANPKHTFSSPGMFTVALEVTNFKGCKDRVQKSIKAKPAPNTEFSLDQFIGCEPLVVNATNITQSDTTFQITNYQWSATNGVVLANTSPVTFVFEKHGLQEISLNATNNLGCSNTTSANILVKQAPKITSTNIPNSPICYNLPLNITVDTDPVSSQIIWKSGLGIGINDSLSKSIQITFENGGVQRVEAELNVNGCEVDTFFLFNVVNKPALSIDYQPNVLCEEDNTTLTASPSDLASYVFKVNNSTLASNGNVATSEKLALANNVVLQTIDQFGCKLTTDTIILTKDKPSARLTSNAVKDTICFSQPLQLDAFPAGLDDYRFVINGVEQQSGTLSTYSLPNANQPVDVVLIVEKNGCKDTASLKTIQTKLPPPVSNINCIESGFDYVTFGFDVIKGNNTYEISIDNGPFISIPSSNGEYTIKQLSANTEYKAQLRVKLPNQSPCDSLVLSDIATCKTIPCEKLDFKLKPLVEKFCETGSATFHIDSIVSPSGTYNIYWDGVKSDSVNYVLSNLKADQSPYNIVVAIEDTTRSQECKITQKKATVYVDKQPDTTTFLYTYEVDGLCKPEPSLKLTVVNPNPTYTYSFKSSSGASASGSEDVMLAYQRPDSTVELKIESPNQACVAKVKRNIDPQSLDQINSIKIDSLLSTVYDSMTCESGWIYHLHTSFDTAQLNQLKKFLPGFKSLAIDRIYTPDEAPDDLDPSSKAFPKSGTGTYSLTQIPNQVAFSYDMPPGKSYSIKDSVTFLNKNGCAIAWSNSPLIDITRPMICEFHPFLYCNNREDTITIERIQKDFPCPSLLNAAYFSEQPQGYTLVDSFTVKRNGEVEGTTFYLKNTQYPCYNDKINVCSFYCDTSLYIPNAITPNGDHKNDKWEIRHANGKVALKIYNRWEQLVYSKDDYANDFEGVSNHGVLLPDGVYFYEMTIDGASHLVSEDFGRNAKTLEDVTQKEYSIFSYGCESKPYGAMKGKLLIQR